MLLSIALLLGVTAGLAGGAVDAVIGRFLDMLFAFPNLFLALLFVTVFQATATTLVLPWASAPRPATRA